MNKIIFLFLFLFAGLLKAQDKNMSVAFEIAVQSDALLLIVKSKTETKISSLQFGIQHQSANLTYSDLIPGILSGMSRNESSEICPQRIAVVWIDPDGKFRNIQDGDILFTLKFAMAKADGNQFCIMPSTGNRCKAFVREIMNDKSVEIKLADACVQYTLSNDELVLSNGDRLSLQSLKCNYQALTHTLHISGNRLAEASQVDIFHINGQLIFSEKLKNQKLFQRVMPGLSSGTYNCIVSKQNIQIERFNFIVP